MFLLDQPLPTPAFDVTERTVSSAVQWLRLGVEGLGSIIIGLGVVIGIWQFVRVSGHRTPESYNAIRLTLARYLAVALEFQLASDLLSTAVAPDWTKIGQLGAIAAIRTALNYFLGREIAEERAKVEEGSASPRDVGSTVPRG